MWTDDWRRNLAALWVGQAMTLLAFTFFFPFIPLYVQTLDVHGTAAAASWAGAISAAASLSMAVAQPFWGRMSDRLGRKPMVLRSMVGSGVLTLVMGFATSAEQLLVLRFIQGAVTGTIASSTALVATSMPKDRLGYALGLMQVAVFMGASVGPLVGGFVADVFGYRASFYAAGTLMLLATIVVAAFVREDFRPAPAGAARKGMWAESRGLMGIALFPLLVGVIFLIQFGNTTVSPVLTLFIAEISVGGSAATTAGTVLAMTGVVSAVSALVIGRMSDRIGHRVVLPVCLLGAAIAYFPQALVQQVWQLLLLRMLLGVFLGGLMPSANAMVAGLIPHARRGAAFGLTSSANALSTAAGPLFGAAIASTLGMREVFVATGITFAVAYVWVVCGLRSHRADLPRAKPTAPEGLHRRAAEGESTVHVQAASPTTADAGQIGPIGSPDLAGEAPRPSASADAAEPPRGPVR